MEAVKLSIAQLNSRVRAIEERLDERDQELYELQQEQVEPEEPVEHQCTEVVLARVDPFIEELTMELQQKGKELDKLMDDLKYLDVDEPDDVSVCTEAAVEELKKVDGVDVSCETCNQCIKKKHKKLKMTEKEKKKEMKQKQKALIEQQKKIVMDEQSILSTRLRRQKKV